MSNEKHYYLLTLFSCTPTNNNIPHVTTPVSTTENFYREAGFMAGAVDAVIGENVQYFAELENKEFARFYVDSVRHTFQVDVYGAPVFEITLTLMPNMKVCVRIQSTPELAGVALIPLVAHFTPNFIMSEVTCLTSEFFSQYELLYGA